LVGPENNNNMPELFFKKKTQLSLATVIEKVNDLNYYILVYYVALVCA
jgi:hypothetical protein